MDSAEFVTFEQLCRLSEGTEALYPKFPKKWDVNIEKPAAARGQRRQQQSRPQQPPKQTKPKITPGSIMRRPPNREAIVVKEWSPEAGPTQHVEPKGNDTASDSGQGSSEQTGPPARPQQRSRGNDRWNYSAPDSDQGSSEQTGPPAGPHQRRRGNDQWASRAASDNRPTQTKPPAGPSKRRPGKSSSNPFVWTAPD